MFGHIVHVLSTMIGNQESIKTDLLVGMRHFGIDNQMKTNAREKILEYLAYSKQLLILL
jgi:hypothetical protein